MVPPMARYAAKLTRTASATASLGSFACDVTTPRRVKLYEWIFGVSGLQSDVAYLLRLQRFTAAGTSTGVTPFPLDPADAAALTDVGENHTVEPTYTANAILYDEAQNLRTTVRWAAQPYGELVTPATASNGLGLATPTAGSTVAINATLHFEEQ